MFDSKLNYDSKAFIDGKELFGVTSFDISYSNSLDVLSVLGSRNGIHASSSPTSSKVSISRDFICRDDFLNKTGSTGVYSDFSFVNQAIPFSGGLYYNSKLYGFTGGYVSNYSVNCAVGSVPKNSVVFDVFDVIQEMPLYIKNKNFVNFKNPGFDSALGPLNSDNNVYDPFWRRIGGRGLQNESVWHTPGAYQGDFFYVQENQSSLSQFVYFPERTSGNISIWVSTRKEGLTIYNPLNMSLYLNSSLKQTINSGQLQTNGIWVKKIFSGMYIESGWNEISFVFSGQNGALVVDYVSINDNDPPNTLQKVNQGSIVISSPNSSTNRVVGFDYSMTKNNMPIYSVGSKTPVFVESMYPITYNASVQIEVDDAFLSNSDAFFTNRNDKNIYLSINGIESIPSFFAQITGNFTWSGATGDAAAKGGRLAIINTLKKQKEVESISFSGARWIGGSYNTSSSKFVNIDNTYVDDGYKNWQTNKPNINDGFYMTINKDNDYKWNTSANATATGYIIEFLEVTAENQIKKFAIPNATLVSEKLTASSDGVLNLTLEYIGTS